MCSQIKKFIVRAKDSELTVNGLEGDGVKQTNSRAMVNKL